MPIFVSHSALDVQKAHQAIRYIQSNFKENMSPVELSEEVNLTVLKLQYLIKRLTGHTVHNFLLKVKIERSKDALCEMDVPIKYIAKTFGFSSATHYNRIFKETTGITPTQYRFEVIRQAGLLEPVNS